MSKMYTKAAIQITFNVETCHDRVQPACKWRCFKPTRIHVHVQGWIYMYGADPAYTPLKSPKLSFSGRNNMSYRGKNNCGALNNRFLGYISCGQRVFCFCFCCQKIWKPTHPQPNILDMCLMLLCNTMWYSRPTFVWIYPSAHEQTPQLWVNSPCAAQGRSFDQAAMRRKT